MKSITIGSFIVVLALVGIMAYAPSAFADATVTITKGSASGQACVTAVNCFDPDNVQVSPGDTVTWTNSDTASHTATSGKLSDNQTGTIFDSSLINPGGTFAFKFTDAGTYNYYCQVHPWMTGIVTVVAKGTNGSVSLGGMQITSMNGMKMIGATTMENMMSTDGSTEISINTSPAAPVSGQPFTIYLTFTDSNKNPIKHQNYIITAMQDGNPVLSNATGHTHTGNDVQVTNILTSANPVGILVTLNGVGLPGTDPSTWTGPKGDMISFHVVPEFGSIASLILVIAVVSVIAVTARTRGFLKF